MLNRPIILRNVWSNLLSRIRLISEGSSYVSLFFTALKGRSVDIQHHNKRNAKLSMMAFDNKPFMLNVVKLSVMAPQSKKKI